MRSDTDAGRLFRDLIKSEISAVVNLMTKDDFVVVDLFFHFNTNSRIKVIIIKAQLWGFTIRKEGNHFRFIGTLVLYKKKKEKKENEQLSEQMLNPDRVI